jgi:glycosyltransferase involved in cell wall biosynthesis
VKASPALVTVVVPVLDAEPWIGEQLEALARQTYAGDWEALIVDNGCRDRSGEIARGFAGRLPGLRIVTAHARRSLNHARNAGAAAARGDFLAFCDADDVVTETWLEALAAAAHRADIVGGTFELDSLNPPLYRAWRPDRPPADVEVEHGFLPFVSGGNCGVWTAVAREVGWDEAYDYGSSEAEFCWRAQLASHTVGFAPEAVIRLRYRRSLRGLARQYRGYGCSAPSLYRSFRHVGMQRDNREALRWWGWLLRHSPDLLRSAARRGNWVRIAAFRWGRVAGSVRARTLFL